MYWTAAMWFADKTAVWNSLTDVYNKVAGGMYTFVQFVEQTDWPFRKYVLWTLSWIVLVWHIHQSHDSHIARGDLSKFRFLFYKLGFVFLDDRNRQETCLNSCEKL